jgi:hypothetical protein
MALFLEAKLPFPRLITLNKKPLSCCQRINLLGLFIEPPNQQK